jgi:hypothetical protein
MGGGVLCALSAISIFHDVAICGDVSPITTLWYQTQPDVGTPHWTTKKEI